MEILSAKGVTLRRLTSLVEGSGGADPAAVTPDDGSGISFLPRESAGEVEGFPLVGVINSRTVDLSKCTIEGEGNPLVMLIAVIQPSSMKKNHTVASVRYVFPLFTNVLVSLPALHI